MNSLLQSIRRHARADPARPALIGARATIAYGDLPRTVDAELAIFLGLRSAAVAMDNGPAWAVVDLALATARTRAVPLPGFFSLEQKIHALRDAGVECLITDQPEQARDLLEAAGIPVWRSLERTIAGEPVTLLPLSQHDAAAVPTGTAKITYTSGTTGKPKGVCLPQAHMERVAASLIGRCALKPGDRHLSLLPLATLLENVGGIYAPLLAGATCCLPPLAETGMNGASGLDPDAMLAALRRHRATSTILVPKMLAGAVDAMTSGATRPADLMLAAVGGAPLAPLLLQRARELGVPAVEGYGLTECGSVVALNPPGAARPGSVGVPLAHARVSISAEGEVLVSDPGFLGYRGGEEAPAGPWPTGDLGYLDDDGHLYLHGRRKHIFITAYGRNVSPDWVEAALCAEPEIAQAAVFGEASPWNSAVVVSPLGACAEGRRAIGQAIARANRALPDYARVSAWICASAPFSPANGQLTANGRVRREAVWSAYRSHIQELYREKTHALL